MVAAPATASTAFMAAETASAATAAVLGSTPASVHVAKLKAPDSEACERIAAVHRLNERFAACASYSDAMELAGKVCDQELCRTLVDLMTDCDALVELAIQLLQNLSLHGDGARAIASAGALPVIMSVLRADEPLLRSQGLTMLVAFAERPEMIRPLVKAGVIKLICFLGRGMGPSAHWPLLLELSECVLRDPLAVPERQQQMLRDALANAAVWHKAGSLPLSRHDIRRLPRLMLAMRAQLVPNPRHPERWSDGRSGSAPLGTFPSLVVHPPVAGAMNLCAQTARN